MKPQHALLALALLLSACGKTQNQACSSLVVSDAWIRSLPPGPTVTAGYLQIENHGEATVTLSSFSSADFERVELHETRDLDGQLQMRAITGLEIAPGDILAMRPGGKHLMLFNPKLPLKPGEQHKLNLHCAASSLSIMAD
ncbi:MAG: copper chaperone PCu(A)C, partial [Nevskiales bacterium]